MGGSLGSGLGFLVLVDVKGVDVAETDCEIRGIESSKRSILDKSEIRPTCICWKLF